MDRRAFILGAAAVAAAPAIPAAETEFVPVLVPSGELRFSHLLLYADDGRCVALYHNPVDKWSTDLWHTLSLDKNPELAEIV